MTKPKIKSTLGSGCSEEPLAINTADISNLMYPLLLKDDYMNIYKSQNKTEDFTTIYNEAPRSKMSLEAIGLWTYIMTLPVNWRLNVKELRTHFPKNSEKQIRRIIRELIENGYIKREQKKSKENGKFLEYEYKAFECSIRSKSQGIPGGKKNQEGPKGGDSSLPEESESDDFQLEGEPLPPRNYYEEIEQQYTDVWKILYAENRLTTPEPIISFAITRRRIKNLLNTYPIDLILNAIKNAYYDNWIIDNGFSLSIILSNNVFNRLVNKKLKKNVDSNEQTGYNTIKQYDPGICPNCGKSLRFGVCPNCGYENI